MLRLVAITQDPHLMDGVKQAFPELLLHIEVANEFGHSNVTIQKEIWDVLILDMATMKADSFDPIKAVDFVLTHARKTIAVVPPHLIGSEPKLREMGTVILHRPITTGELVLAVNRLLREKNGTMKRT